MAGAHLPLLALGLWLALSASARAAPEAVAAGELPWSAVGRVNLAGAGHCTGVLVGPRTVLTAAHCLYNARQGDWIAGEYIRFVAGYERDSYLAQSRVVDYRISAEFDPRSRPAVGNLSHDWAILILETPIGDDVGYFGVRRLDRQDYARLKSDDITYARAGYAHEFAHVISVDRACAMLGFVKDLGLMLHQCPTQPGDSGGPMLALMPGGLAVVGIHNGRIEAKQGKFGTAVPSSNFYDVLMDAIGDDRVTGPGIAYSGKPPSKGALPAPVSIAGPVNARR